MSIISPEYLFWVQKESPRAEATRDAKQRQITLSNTDATKKTCLSTKCNSYNVSPSNGNHPWILPTYIALKPNA